MTKTKKLHGREKKCLGEFCWLEALDSLKIYRHAVYPVIYAKRFASRVATLFAVVIHQFA